MKCIKVLNKDYMKPVKLHLVYLVEKEREKRFSLHIYFSYDLLTSRLFTWANAFPLKCTCACFIQWFWRHVWWIPCTHDNSNIHHNSYLSAETILSSVQHSQSSDERERGYFNGGPLFMINFIFYITCLVNCCLTRLTNLGIPPKLQCDHVKGLWHVQTSGCVLHVWSKRHRHD